MSAPSSKQVAASPTETTVVAAATTATTANESQKKVEESATKSSIFTVPIADFQHLIDPKNKRALDSMGGLARLYEVLRTDPQTGLTSDERFHTELEEQTIVSNPEAKFIERTAAYGRNVLPAERQKNIFELMWIAMHDNTLILLTVVSLVALIVGLYKDLTQSDKKGYEGPYWVEGFAIIIAVLIVLLVQSFNDYQKESQFRKLNAKKEDRAVRGIRNGQNVMISVFDVQAGDILSLEPGDLVAVDGVLITAHNLKFDESAATGESDMIKKQSYSLESDCKDPFVLSGSKVNEGVGKFIVTAVGIYSLHGKTMMGLRVPPQDTPLQVKLDVLAEKIAKIAASVAILLLMVLLIKYLVNQSRAGWPPGEEIANMIINIIIEAIIIVVVAVPEGLPLAVTLALAYATRQMLKDNNLVRVLAACETMGGATTICSDKTGTLTQNEMTVVSGLVGLRFEFNNRNGLTKLADFFRPFFGSADKQQQQKSAAGETSVPLASFYNYLIEGIAVNSTAFEGTDEKGNRKFVGSKTETALLSWARTLGMADFEAIRSAASEDIVQVFPFSSERKMMSLVLRRRLPDGGDQYCYRVYTKGASEIIGGFCSNIYEINQDKTEVEVVNFGDSERAFLQKTIQSYAAQSLRTICLAHRDFTNTEFMERLGLKEDEKLPTEPTQSMTDALQQMVASNLTLVGLVGIEDPLREGVPEAVTKCQRAGVFVRMVTGDNINTAKAIASKCGIYMKGGIVMEGSKFRTLSDQEMTEVVPRLQVLARSSPLDKQILVQKLKNMGETVAVTGDGTNDGPALKMADVGFSMGIAGTEVAKEASAIVLMDDNFSSIVKAMLWGRSVNDSVKKFLQFQLTVNVSAVCLAFITAIANEDNQSILTAVQLLWVNLIMDSLAALSLATDPPTEDLLDRMPESKRSPLITMKMIKMILGQSAFQIALGLVANYYCPSIFGFSGLPDEKVLTRSFVFNMFVFMQLFNEINCRRIDSNLNVFHNIHKNIYFIPILIITIIAQILIIEFGGKVFKVVPITGAMWGGSILIASLSLPIGVMLRLLPICGGCTFCGKDFGEVNDGRVVVTKERLQWNHSINQVRAQLRVFSALRGTGRHPLAANTADGSQSDDGSAIRLADLKLKGSTATLLTSLGRSNPAINTIPRSKPINVETL